jgi:hypothetical protein
MSRLFTHFVLARNKLESVISFIVEKDQRYSCVTILADEKFDEELDMCVACFVFNNKHMWLEKKIGEQWWLIDSRSKGPVQIENGPFEYMSSRGRIFVSRIERF